MSFSLISSLTVNEVKWNLNMRFSRFAIVMVVLNDHKLGLIHPGSPAGWMREGPLLCIGIISGAALIKVMVRGHKNRGSTYAPSFSLLTMLKDLTGVSNGSLGA